LALCALLHLADTTAFAWDEVVRETALERCTRGLAGFEKRFLVPKLMDPEDIVSVPDDKGMTLYLSYVIDILQKKNPQKKTALSPLQRTPDRRQSAPNIASTSGLIPSLKPKYGGGGYIGSPSPVKKGESAPVAQWAKRKVPDVAPEDALVSTTSSSEAPSPSPSSVVVVPPRVIVPGPDNDDRVHELQLQLKSKQAEIEALTEGMRQMEKLLERKEQEHRDAEEKLRRELMAAEALAGAASSTRSGGGSKGGGDEIKVKEALATLQAQVDDLEQHNQMLQMSLEDSRVSQRKLEDSVKVTRKATLSVEPVSEDAEHEELLLHQMREAERRALAAEGELKLLKEGGGVSASSGNGAPREQRLKSQVSELEDKVATLEQEARALKRAADKSTRLERELAEMEERDLKHAQEARDLKKQLNQVTRELEEARGAAGTSAPPTIERSKSGSKLARSPRERNIPKLVDPAPTSATRAMPPPPK
jgi:hypothetical protein